MVIDGARALAWRLRRHALVPVAATSVTDVARRVVAVRGWPARVTDLAVSTRQAEPDSGALGRALEDGDVIRSYAFRGGSYVFTPEIGATLLSARTATRIWETRRWQRQGDFALDDWEPLRDAVRASLSAGPMTRDEIRAHLTRIPALRHLAAGATGAGADSLYKPLHWWGDICFGPERAGQATFRLLSDDQRWPGLPDVDDAGRRAITLYLGAYGPATLDNLGYWLTGGLGVPRRRLLGWVADLGDEVTEVSVDGVRAYMLTVHLDELAAAEAPDTVRLLPGFDPWVLGPGTADTRLVAPERRALISRGNNFVAWNGIVSGTWQVRGRTVTVTWFSEAGPAPVTALGDEVRRLAGIRVQELSLELIAER